MDDDFELPVSWKGSEQLLPARFEQRGYTYRIMVTVHGLEIAFEPDEERAYRAVVAMEDMDQIKKIDRQLLEAIATALTTVFH